MSVWYIESPIPRKSPSLLFRFSLFLRPYRVFPLPSPPHTVQPTAQTKARESEIRVKGRVCTLRKANIFCLSLAFAVASLRSLSSPEKCHHAVQSHFLVVSAHIIESVHFSAMQLVGSKLLSIGKVANRLFPPKKGEISRGLRRTSGKGRMIPFLKWKREIEFNL